MREALHALLDAGAAGFVVKGSAFDELTAAIRSILDERCYVSPELGAGWGVSGPDGGGKKFPKLTAREREVLQRLAEGRTTKEAATDLALSPKTVETHRSNIMTKLNVNSLAELTKYAIREGLTPLDS